MKRCPTCQKTFDDNMRFCQTDGTPLVEDATPADPYKTMVASREDIQAALNAPATANEPSQPGIGAPEEEPLEIPSNPPQSTPASEFETKIAARDVIEIPPLAETPSSEPKKSPEPSAPPSPFSQPEPAGPGDFPTTPPIPSPFSSPKPVSFEPTGAKPSEPEPAAEEEEPTYFEPEPAAPSFPEPETSPSTPQYAEPEPAAAQFNPFQQQSAPQESAVAQSEWAPPPSPVQSTPGMSSPPPAANAGKVNQTLPIVSLVFGILSLCCWISPLTGIIALITGFLGMKNANSNPAQYGGKTLAIVGMILGGIFFLIGLAYWVFVIFFNGAALLMQLANQS